MEKVHELLSSLKILLFIRNTRRESNAKYGRRKLEMIMKNVNNSFDFVVFSIF